MDILGNWFYPTQDQLFTCRQTGSARYVDPDHSETEVEFLPRRAQKPQNDVPFQAQGGYSSRDTMLLQLASKRFEENAQLYKEKKIGIAERYQGFEDKLIDRIKGATLRFFYTIWYGEEKGLTWYDRKLLQNPETLAYLNYNVKPVRNSINKVRVKGILTEDQTKCFTKFTWCRAAEIPLKFTNENGKDEVTHDMVASSSDRTSPHAVNMRSIDDVHTGASISYTGRVDTERKAREQLQFIFEQEMAKNPAQRKGIQKKENSYELTYMVNNLMASNSFLGLFGLNHLTGFDEQASILREKEILESLAKEPISLKNHQGQECIVHIQPVYFNQGFNFLSNFGLPATQKSINAKGNAILFEMIENGLTREDISPKDKELLNASKKALTNTNNLDAHVAFFYRDLVAKILRIPVVNHCKSSVDRTSLATSISAATQTWRNLGNLIPENNPHQILENPLFKDIFMANIHANHQTTYVSRSAEGKVLGEQQLTRQLGFKWGSDRFMLQNHILRDMLPERYLTKNKKFDLDNPLFGKRGLISRKGLKCYYKSSNPLVQEQEEVKKKDEEERMRAIRQLISASPAA